MTNGRESDTRRPFSLTWLPWVLGLATLALYLATLNRSLSFLPDWITYFGTAPSGARIAGWTWQPEFFSPAYYVVTCPLRWLPPAWSPVAANLFSALCAGLALAQLARSVTLLPHDRTRDQRERELDKHALLASSLAWIPPLFAVLVCALGLGFWEHATNGTVEMFDLLLFSYVVRSLLEYRLDKQDSRLYRAALVYGIGMSGNAALTGFFPLFIVALVWTKQLGFFNVRFLGRMTLCGAAGLLFLFVLPLINSFGQEPAATFWQGLKANILVQNQILTVFPKRTLLLLSLTSVLPVFLLSIRWASQFGDPSRIGVVLTTVVFHVCHIVILLACLWVAFDPAFSPRQRGLGFAFLPFYYLGALSIGYYSGYLLVVSRAAASRLRRATPMADTVQHAATVAILVLLVATPAALAWRNLPQIRLTNGPLQNQLAADLARGLPQNGVILSDDSRRLWLVQDWLARQGRSGDFIPLNTQWLKHPEYHRYLKRHHPGWTSPAKDENAKTVADIELVELLFKLSKEKTISYLHPSFGYYFEFFQAKPNGLALQLTPYPDNQFTAAPVSAEVIASNEKFWTDAQESHLQTLLPYTATPDETRRLSLAEKFFRAIRVMPEPNRQAQGLGALYARSLVYWGVVAQRAGDYEHAAKHFAFARELNPENIVAEINLDFNRSFRSGRPASVEIAKSLEEKFGKYRSWEEVLTQNGPYDEPSLTYAQGFVFAQGNLTRQAAQEFERVRALSTNDLASRLWLAQLNLNRNLPDQALALATEVRECARRIPGGLTNITDLFTLEATAYFVKQDPEKATAIIEDNLKANPDNFPLLAAACKTYADNGRYTNALDLTDRMLALDPQNSAGWLNRGSFLVELNNYPEAITAFDRALALQTNNPTARLYRAIANLRSDQLEAAQADYETVQREYPQAFQICYGLGEIAWRRKDTNAALRHYESYLSNAPPQLAEFKFVANRVRELRGEPPEPEK